MTTFDFGSKMTCLCHDLTRVVPELGHVDMRRVLVTASFNRKPSATGVYAAVTPLRFAGGSRVGRHRRATMVMPRVVNEAGEDQLYILTFYLPRYLQAPFEEKLETVTHELWHISPDFDGTLRQFPGKCRIHGPTQEAFDAQARRLANCYLRKRRQDDDRSSEPPWEFLNASWRELQSRYRRLRAHHIARPQMRRLA